MSKWQGVIVTLLRNVLQDISTTPDYDDGRLEDVIVAAAHLVLSEIDFAYTYVINLVSNTIVPDPIDNNDVSFINMVTYKSALMILNSELKTSASQGIIVKDASSVIDVRGNFINQKQRYDLMSKEYDRVKMAIKMGDLNSGLAVLGAYTKEDIPTYIWR